MRPPTDEERDDARMETAQRRFARERAMDAYVCDPTCGCASEPDPDDDAQDEDE